MSSDIDSNYLLEKMPISEAVMASASPADPQQLKSLCRQHAEHLEDNKQLQSVVRKLKHRLDQLQRETSAMQAEHARTLLTRSQLEALCRELQAQNRAIREESLVKVREEGEKRRAVTAQFQTTLSDISGMIADGSQKNAQLTEENTSIAHKLTQLCQQYEQKNKMVAEMMKQKELKTQLSNAELAKVQVEMRKERGKFAEEKQKLLQAVTAQRAQHTALLAADAKLKTELESYVKRFDELQEDLANSSGTFDTYKTDMAKMQKTIARLERESAGWRQKCAANNQALLTMAEQKQADDVLLATQQRRLDTLQRLCTALESRAGLKISRSSSSLSTTGSTTQSTVESITQSTTKSAADSGTTSGADSVAKSTADSGTKYLADSSSQPIAGSDTESADEFGSEPAGDSASVSEVMSATALSGSEDAAPAPTDVPDGNSATHQITRDGPLPELVLGDRKQPSNQAVNGAGDAPCKESKGESVSSTQSFNEKEPSPGLESGGDVPRSDGGGDSPLCSAAAEVTASLAEVVTTASDVNV